ncbi:27497_t:CDS:2, partial [Gigaspora margarita]
DLPSIKITQVRSDNVPAPNVYFAFATSFTIGCTRIDGISATSCNQSIIQPTFNATIQAYNGSFASNIKMDGSSVIRFDLYFTSTEDSIRNYTSSMFMSVMDPGYGPNTAQYHSSIFPYNEPFVQSVELKNIYHLSQNSNYIVRYSRTIRYMSAPGDFGSLIGVRPRYYEIPYVESNIEYIIYKNYTIGGNWYASVAITPVTTIVNDETEQSPWGYVQKRIISKEGLNYTADTLADLAKLSLEDRVRRLEEADMFLNDHVIGIPFDRDVKGSNQDDHKMPS